MDLLAGRYASPFSMLDELIKTKQFGDWVDWFLQKVLKEKNDKTLWEFFLHKVYDKSFDDWKSELNADESGTSAANMDNAQQVDIIRKSEDILKRFTPKMTERGKDNG